MRRFTECDGIPVGSDADVELICVGIDLPTIRETCRMRFDSDRVLFQEFVSIVSAGNDVERDPSARMGLCRGDEEQVGRRGKPAMGRAGK